MMVILAGAIVAGCGVAALGLQENWRPWQKRSPAIPLALLVIGVGIMVAGAMH